jgi:hypothetical protein
VCSAGVMGFELAVSAGAAEVAAEAAGLHAWWAHE